MAEVSSIEQDWMVAEWTQTQKQRRIVAKCMHHVPDYMDHEEGSYLMNMLYKFGTLSHYLTDLRRGYSTDFRIRSYADEEDEDGDDEVLFSSYFDFDEEDNTIKIDSETGRITF